MALEVISQNKLKTIRKLKLKKYRYLNNNFICEGYRIFSEAIKQRPEQVSEVLLTKNFIDSSYGKSTIEKCKINNIPVYLCSEKTMESITDLQTSPGILFTAKLIVYSETELKNIKQGNCIFLENVSDPGNIGTIIRTAAWFGIHNILLSPSSVDPFEMKVVRATAGSIFYINFYTNIKIESLKKMSKEYGFQLISTVIKDGIPLSNWKVSAKNIIFFGSEASGLTKSALKISDRAISVTGNGELESLNLAVSAGIIMNHLYQNT